MILLGIGAIIMIVLESFLGVRFKGSSDLSEGIYKICFLLWGVAIGGEIKRIMDNK